MLSPTPDSLSGGYAPSEPARPKSANRQRRRGERSTTLREEPAVSDKPWLSRQKEARAKLTGGDPLGLAEIVRDCASREQSLTAKGAKTQLSPNEKDVFAMARQLLSIEIAHVRGVGATEADGWINQQLTRA